MKAQNLNMRHKTPIFKGIYLVVSSLLKCLLCCLSEDWIKEVASDIDMVYSNGFSNQSIFFCFPLDKLYLSRQVWLCHPKSQSMYWSFKVDLKLKHVCGVRSCKY